MSDEIFANYCHIFGELLKKCNSKNMTDFEARLYEMVCNFLKSYAYLHFLSFRDQIITLEKQVESRIGDTVIDEDEDEDEDEDSDVGYYR